ncbi:MAG: carboxypeptidase-like regulatory domain-containing protein [Bacteroidales bacterium]
MRKLLLLVFFLCGVMLSVAAQQKVITGTVTSADDGMTVIGATVQIKGSSTGVTTDLDGRYSIEANTGDILVFRFVGLRPRKLKLGQEM